MENTIGDVPVEWYREEEHIGYDANGRRILKRKWNDSIEHLLHMVDDPSYWRKVFDEKEDRELSMSQSQLELIRRLRGSLMPSNLLTESYTHEEVACETSEQFLLSSREPKRRFIPSRWEAKLVLRIIRAMRNNTSTKPAKNSIDDAPKLIWDAGEAFADMNHNALTYLPAPKAKSPSHEDSYNPPFEYRQELSSDPRPGLLDRSQGRHFYDALRVVPAYSAYVIERFQRCLDLYLCPRVARNRLEVQPNEILPLLPNPQELKPFPSSRCLKYTGHLDKVLSISVDPTGQWLLSGSADCSMRKWEVNTGRCVKKWQFGEVVKCVDWCPRIGVNIVSACVGHSVVLLNPNKELCKNDLDQHLTSARAMRDCAGMSLPWKEKDEVVVVNHNKPVMKVTWHKKGDYFATLVSGGNNVLIHRISRKSSQHIFRQQKYAKRNLNSNDDIVCPSQPTCQ
mmetsp:Transcript_15594/g.37765  ORF Transcript_15594/g.37765 Transcript_15594/m.37765 type:complete len:453 (+) Transcript_15594:252-1610(+)